jgi:adenine-specific DNA-methyltransferase
MSKVRLTAEFDPAADCVVYPGDCRHLLKQVPDGLMQLVVTSPPYNLRKPYESRQALGDYLHEQRPIIEERVRVLSRRAPI